MSQSVLNLDRQLCFRAYTASRLTIRLYKPLLDKIHLTYPQYVAMMVLWEKKSIGFRDLGKKLHMSTGTLTPVIQRLEKLGYVKKEKHETDDRKTVVVLTSAGKALMPEAEKIPVALAKALGLSVEAYKEYADMLDDLLLRLENAKIDID
ncbi:MarR family winged helix-turn-helix transcriptional regulator [Fusibacter sp. JL216-2]|uniref:MarR family winged helix-turn-helix transcriptional regulator n=1 Tax=Fusibacter sp. JL216-2 TaxID=3071453 RepID=UPI003D33C3BF